MNREEGTKDRAVLAKSSFRSLIITLLMIADWAGQLENEMANTFEAQRLVTDSDDDTACARDKFCAA